ncbi:NADH:flavin oxidoreductase [Paenibacillus farraposensis]|uniref:NADH:flavin oxidoreductase n=1 Tax=Paenibacillus farraposensis TaxID=2807095 RepID=A0ABW4D694_9BACL|nr:NADH:flavin oxidoreductase [Paenibacillus farraposensis]MCC3381652.1 NADH:flavin oxidoreductase [Paenibacillus farraposensis]
MTSRNRTLLSSYHLGHLTLKNRVVLAAMTRASADPDGRPTERMVRYYASFAAGDFAMLITESTYMDNKLSKGSLDMPGITNESHIQGWKRVIDAVHAKGAKMIIQLAHVGALSQWYKDEDVTVAPSSYKPEGERVPAYGPGGEFPVSTALKVEEIKELVQNFARAAANAKKAGADGIELHVGKGFLHDQFLTEYTNNREDEYGGSLENRLRFIVETVQAIRASTGDNFIVGVEISQYKMNNFGFKWPNGEADAKIIFESIAHSGADYIHVTDYVAKAPAFGESGPTLAALAKKYGRIPVIVNGSIMEPEDAEQVLNEGGDLISIARMALANHDWPIKVREGLPLNPFAGDVLADGPTIKDSEMLSVDEI